nr:HNH endonuclease signature motif containing protein [Brucella intermedia]
MEKKPLPPISRLHEVLTYDPVSGELRWKERANNKTFNTRYAFKAAGVVNGRYLKVSIDGNIYTAHRIAWALQTGQSDFAEIDHVNGNTFDNSYSNLRAVTHRKNMRNLPLRSDNSTGAHGVYFNAKTRRWYAQCCHGKQNKHLGTFDNFQDAVEARRSFQLMNGYHPNHGRGPTRIEKGER